MSEENGNTILKISELTPNVRNISLTVKVVELGEPREIFNRKTNENHTVMDVLIGDETGTVYFSAWNEHIERIHEKETYTFVDSKTILYKGHIRVSLGRNGSFIESEEKIDEVNTEINMSSEEHDIRPKYGRGRNY